LNPTVKVVDTQFSDLNKFECATSSALLELTKQHDLMEALVDSEVRASVIRLLSSSLRASQFLQLERKRLRQAFTGASGHN